LRQSSGKMAVACKICSLQRCRDQSVIEPTDWESVLYQLKRLSRALGVLAFLSACCGFAVQPAYADGSVSSLHMGKGAHSTYEFGQFQSVISQYNGSGERFRIDGRCQSACTMFLSIRSVCVSPGATLAFHSGLSPSVTQAMLSTYNAALQQYVTENHFMDTRDFHSIPGNVIINRFGYPACR
jgi:hypothetical protein